MVCCATCPKPDALPDCATPRMLVSPREMTRRHPINKDSKMEQTGNGGQKMHPAPGIVPERGRAPKGRVSGRKNEVAATFVYVIVDEKGRCKIGVSRDPRARRSSLQGGNGSRLYLSGSVEVGSGRAFEVEKAAHTALAKVRRQGEWFEASSSLVMAMIHCLAAKPAREEAVRLLAEKAIYSAKYEEITREILRSRRPKERALRDQLDAELAALREEFEPKNERLIDLGIIVDPLARWRAEKRGIAPLPRDGEFPMFIAPQVTA